MLQNKWFFANILIEVIGVNTAEIDNLRIRVNTHKDNLLKQKKLLRAQEEWRLMLNDVEEMVEELQKQYEKTNSEEDKAKLEEWVKEQKDYLNLLDEYTHDINKINVDLNVYRDEDYRIELNFIERLTRYNENVKRIKEIEEISIKSLQNSDYQESRGNHMIDDYGCQHYILSEYVDTYAQLIYNQKQLSSYIKSNYDLIFNGVYEPPIKVEVTPKLDIEPEEMEYYDSFNDADELKIQYQKLQNILDSGKLSEEQEIELLKRFQYNILHKPKTGKKSYEHINGEKLEIPRKYSGYYHNANRWLHNRLKNNIIEEPIEKIEDTSDKSLPPKEEEYIDINQFATNQENKVISIQKVSKPINKKKLKRTLRTVGIMIASTIIAGSSLIMTSINDLVKQDNNSKKQVKVTEHLEKETLVNKTNDEVNEHIDNTRTHKHKHNKNYNYNLGDVVSMKQGSDIYSNAQDSVEHHNGKKPYFSNKTKNRITGITLTFKDDIATFVALPNVADTYEVTIGGKITYLTEKEAENKIQDMKQQGWKEEGVAVTNVNASDGITGFYNIDEISGGKTR